MKTRINYNIIFEALVKERLESFLKKVTYIYYIMTEEYQFHDLRKWKFDYFILFFNQKWDSEIRIAFELEGGVWSRGRHTRGQGYINDCEKYNSAQLLGYQVYRFTTDDITRRPKYMSEMLREIFDKAVRELQEKASDRTAPQIQPNEASKETVWGLNPSRKEHTESLLRLSSQQAGGEMDGERVLPGVRNRDKKQKRTALGG